MKVSKLIKIPREGDLIYIYRAILDAYRNLDNEVFIVNMSYEDKVQLEKDGYEVEYRDYSTTYKYKISWK